eukprot:13298424-Alexandrium_andersonii.AAC.1
MELCCALQWRGNRVASCDARRGPPESHDASSWAVAASDTTVCKLTVLAGLATKNTGTNLKA